VSWKEDRNMTLLAAEAYGMGHMKDTEWGFEFREGGVIKIWEPLENDEQAFRLVQKLNLNISWFTTNTNPRNQALVLNNKCDHNLEGRGGLKRAIVECVSKTQKAKKED
jgi:hypothetical protein